MNFDEEKTASRVMAGAEGQQAEEGRVISFEDYLARSLRPPPGPVFWPWAKIRQALQPAQHGERGTLALETPGGSPGTVTPGLSLAVQVMRPGEQTHPTSILSGISISCRTGLAKRAAEAMRLPDRSSVATFFLSQRFARTGSAREMKDLSWLHCRICRIAPTLVASFEATWMVR